MMPPHRPSETTQTPYLRSDRSSNSQFPSKKARFHLSCEDTMDAVNIPTERIPEDLKVCEQILKRGKEVKKVEPVVAYWCCFSAAHKIMDVRNRSKEGTAFLMSILDALEEMKGILADNDAVTNEAAGAAYVQNFALKVFMGADNDDRNGITGKATVRKFVVAGQFIEILRCFENGMTEEMEQKLQYARWKAADGAKALREGREPTSGPPIPDEPLLPELPSGSPGQNSQLLSGSPSQNTPTSHPSRLSSTPTISPQPSPAHQARANLPGLDVSDSRTPGRTNSTASGAWSTVATPGLAEDDDEERRFDLPAVPAASLADEAKSPQSGEKRNVRFAGPDGAPLSPAQTHVTVESYDAPDAPPPTTFGDCPTSPKPSAPAMSKGDSSSSSRSNGSNSAPANSGDRPGGEGNVSHHSLPSGSRNTPAGNARPSPSPKPTTVPPPPPPSLASYPSVPPSTTQPNGLGLTSPPPSAPPLSSLPGLAHPNNPNNPVTAYHNNPIPKLTRKQVEQTQKHARWAVSALEFDDAETARSELRKALAILGG